METIKDKLGILKGWVSSGVITIEETRTDDFYTLLNQIETLSTTDKPDGLVLVSKDDAQSMIKEIQDLKLLVGSSMFLVDFIMNTFFDGEFPERMSIAKGTKLMIKLPSIINDIPDEDHEKIGKALDIVRKLGGELKNKILPTVEDNTPKQLPNGE